MVRSETAIAPPAKPSRVLFVRVGWMTNYAGPQPGDERPKGGGGYTKKNLGNELFNFGDFDGHLYGFARAKNGKVNLKRIDPTAEASAENLDEVLVIFVAQQCIIGWYRNATVYATTKPKFPASVTKEMSRRLKQSGMKSHSLWGYQFEAAVGSAILLPTYERKQKVAGNVKGGFGRSNIRYISQTGSKTKSSAWMNEAIQYVLSYDRANVLNDPDAQVNSEEAAAIAQEKAGGFQSDPKIRKAIEQHAMRTAQKALEKLGYGKFVNTSSSKPYDYTCQKLGKSFFAEVKGTQTKGKSVILTKNEVANVRGNPNRCILVVVHSVKINGRIAYSGTTEVTEQWVLTDGELTASQYVWKR